MNHLDVLISKNTGISKEQLTPSSLLSWQISRFREILSYAKEKSRFYGAHFSQIDASSIQTTEDISLLPTISAQDITKNGFEMLCVMQHDIYRIITLLSSGTKGASKRIYFTKKDLIYTVDFFSFGMREVLSPPCHAGIFMSGEAPGSVGTLLKEALLNIGVTSEIFGGITSLSDALLFLTKTHFDCLIGLPEQILALAEASKNTPGFIPPKSVLLSADFIPNALIKKIKMLWNTDVFSHYGMTETGLGGGVDCSFHTGYHLRHDALFFEVLEPNNEGYGELCVTTLNREAMPLIRYRTGDIGKIVSTPCPCGSILPRIEQVRGRKQDFIAFSNGRRLSLFELGELLHSFPEILDFEASASFEENTLRLFLKTIPSENILDESHLAEQIEFKINENQTQNFLKIIVNTSGFIEFQNNGQFKKRWNAF